MSLPRVAHLPPELSAQQVPTPAQTRLAGALLGLAILGLATVPALTWGFVFSLLALIFLSVALLRSAALH